jgi:hypothetical protein
MSIEEPLNNIRNIHRELVEKIDILRYLVYTVLQFEGQIPEKEWEERRKQFEKAVE